MELTLALIFDDLSTRLNEAYETRAQQYRRQYLHSWWRNLTWRYDADQTGHAADAARPPTRPRYALSLAAVAVRSTL
jgi:hypothetical protein